MIFRRPFVFMLLALVGCNYAPPPHAPILPHMEQQNISASPMLLSYPANLPKEDVVAHLAWLKIIGYNPVKISDITHAANGQIALPPNPVVLYFENIPLDFYTRILPLLKLYNFPGLLAVSKKLNAMNMSRLKEMAKTGLLEFAIDGRDIQDKISFLPQYSASLHAQSGIRPDILLWPYLLEENKDITRYASGLGMIVISTGEQTLDASTLQYQKADLVKNWPQISAQSFRILSTMSIVQ